MNSPAFQTETYSAPTPPGYEKAFDKGREADPVVITQRKDDFDDLQAWGIPVLLGDLDWSQANAAHVEGWRLVFLPGSTKKFRMAICKAVEAFASTNLIDDLPAKTLAAFIEGDGTADTFEDHLYNARHYEYREEAAKAQSHGWTWCKLMETDFPELTWIVPGVLPEGLSLLSGAPKIGKSWFALDLALSVATGRPFLGDITPVTGDVLYWALEDGPGRLQRRLELISGDNIEPNERLTLRTAEKLPPPLDQGGLEIIQDWCEGVENPALVIIDVLQKVRPEGVGNESEYSALYRGLKDIHAFAQTFGLSVLVIHHNRKGGRSLDPFEDVAGSLAFTSLPDATLILRRDSSGNADGILYGRGRDLNEFDIAMDFENLRWIALGDAASVQRSDQRNAILECLAKLGEPMKPKEIATALGEPVNNISALLKKMVKASEVKKSGYGLYSLPPPG